MQNTVTATIDLQALRKNMQVVRALCPKSKIMAMVKADAYGHGLIPIAKALSADGLAVARLQEALQLRKEGVSGRILLLGTLLTAENLAVCSQYEIDVTAHDEKSVALIAAKAKRNPLRVWLKLDSGMHRVGLDPESFMEADQLLAKQPGVLELIHMTHFSCAHDKNSSVIDEQLYSFWQCHHSSSKAQISLANSAALIARSDTHADWVHPGIMLYGDNPFGIDQTVHLEPVMTVRARVIAVRAIGIGESVGYNQRWTSARPSIIGTIGMGYGDGYPRHARNGTPVWINGGSVPLVGQVSMDSLTVDLTDCLGVDVGDEVMLWGTELPPAVVAKYADTISYELLTSLQGRVQRAYTD